MAVLSFLYNCVGKTRWIWESDWEIRKKRKFLNKLVKILPSNSLDVRNATKNVGKGCVSLDEMTCPGGDSDRASSSSQPHASFNPLSNL